MRCYVTVGKLRVDVQALAELDHRCDPRACTARRCCCSKYEVCVRPAEVTRIIGFLPHAAAFRPQIRTARGYDNVFEDLGQGLCCLDTTDDGLCVLAYKEHGCVRCSLHSAAAALGLPAHRAKPRACVLWPLALSSSRPQVLSVDPDVYGFGCATRRPAGAALCEAVVDTLECAFGAAFRKRVEEAVLRDVGPRLRRARRPLGPTTASPRSCRG
jgi:hypothetical protein